jgi:hypothetical protein
VFIEALQKKDQDRLDSCLELVRKAKKGELIIVTSAYALVEVQRLDDLEKKEGVSREDQSKMILLFFQNPFISMRPLDPWQTTRIVFRSSNRTFKISSLMVFSSCGRALILLDFAVFFMKNPPAARSRFAPSLR